MSGSVLVVLLATVIALLMATIVLLLAHGAWVEHRRNRRGSEVEWVRNVLVESLLGNPLADEDALRLQAFDPRLMAEILLELSQWLRPTNARDDDVLEHLGLSARARAMLFSHRWSKRLAGARLITLLGSDEDLVPGLIADPHPLVRAQAAEWISSHPSAEMIKAVLPLLDDDDGLVRHAATDCLIRIGLPAGPALCDLLARSSDSSARAALAVAAEVNDPALLEPVLARVASTDAEIRRLVALVLGNLGGERAAGALATLVDDPDAGVRAAAIAGLGWLKHWPVAVALCDRLGDESWIVRKESGLALRRFGAAGVLLLRRATHAEDRFAADMARLVLEVSEVDDELGIAACT